MLIGVFGMFIGGYLAEPALRNLMDRQTVETRKPEAHHSHAEAAADGSTEEVEVGEDGSALERSGPEQIPEDGLPETEAAAEERGNAEVPVAAGMEEGHPIRQIMERSLLADEVSHFSVAQIVEFTQSGQLERDGVAYDFGILRYRDDTIFGERIYDAQALIRDGKVETWIWPSNGMKIP